MLNLADLDHELAAAKKLMKPGGVYICSVASVTSSRNLFVPIQGGFKNHMTWSDYDRKFKEYFHIRRAEVFGFYLPLIWRWPAFASLVHRVAELICAKLFPHLFHEKIYILEAKHS